MTRTIATRTPGQGILFDGQGSSVSVGTLGTFGSSLSAGVYLSFQIQVQNSTTRFGVLGYNHVGGPELDVFLNWNGSAVLPYAILFNMRDASGRRLEGYCTYAALFDGNSHTVIITASPGTNTITISVDGSAQAITYVSQATPSNFINLPLPMYLGCWNNGSAQNVLAGILQSVQIGTASNALYGSWQMQEGAGLTTADSSGNGNTGTLNGAAWVAAASLGRRMLAPSTPVPVLIDTDANSDIDDFGAVAIALRLQQLGYCTVLGINVDTSSTYSPGALDAMRKYLGLSAIPISSHAAVGTFQPVAASAAYQYVYNNFAHDVGLASSLSAPNTNFRTLLAAQSHPDVVMIALGYGNDLAALLQSPADGISPLTGLQLVAASCKLLVWTGGIYPSGTDPANFARDLTDAAYVIANWPTPIVFVPGGTGFPNNILAPNTLSSLPAASPAKAAYQQFGAPDYGHASWDMITAIYALENPGLWLLTGPGTNSLNVSTGVNTFTPGVGQHYYLTNSQTYLFYQNHLTELLRV